MALTFRELALQAALKEAAAHVREVGGNNRGPRVQQYQAADSYAPNPDTGYAWCNSFVDWCFQQAGHPLVELDRSAGVELTLDLARKRGWVVSDPQPGDLVIYTFSHIGFVVKRESATSLITVEGNTSPLGAVSDSTGGGDGVYVKRRSTSLVRAYVRVPGDTAFKWTAPKKVVKKVVKKTQGYVLKRRANGMVYAEPAGTPGGKIVKPG